MNQSKHLVPVPVVPVVPVRGAIMSTPPRLRRLSREVTAFLDENGFTTDVDLQESPSVIHSRRLSARVSAALGIPPDKAANLEVPERARRLRRHTKEEAMDGVEAPPPALLSPLSPLSAKGRLRRVAKPLDDAVAASHSRTVDGDSTPPWAREPLSPLSQPPDLPQIPAAPSPPPPQQPTRRGKSLASPALLLHLPGADQLETPETPAVLSPHGSSKGLLLPLVPPIVPGEAKVEPSEARRATFLRVRRNTFVCRSGARPDS